MKSLLFSIHTWFHRREMEQSMKAEMQQHIELQAAEYERQGLSPAQALRKAKKVFGNQTFLQEDCRASWGMRIIDEVTNDLGFAWKQLRKHSLFTGTAVLSLGVGIGVNLILFSALNALLLKPLPVEHPEQLREIKTITPFFNGSTSGRMISLANDLVEFNAICYPLLEAFQQRASGIAEFFCWADTGNLIVEIGNQKRSAYGRLISDNHFQCLNAKPLLGSFQLDSTAGDDPVFSVWISESIWKRSFDKDPSVIGKTVFIKNHAFSIVGVVPQSFRGLEKGNDLDYYFPLEAVSVLNPYYKLDSNTHHFLRTGVRLKNPAFEKELQPILTDALRNSKISFQGTDYAEDLNVLLIDASRGIKAHIEMQGNHLKTPIIMALMLLVVSCVNLAGLQFARNFRRLKELNIRSALGASRIRLIRQLLTETLLLCFAGSLNGLLLTLLGHKWLNLHFVYSINSLDTFPDIRMFLIFAFLLTACTVVIGVIPAVRVTRLNNNLHLQHRSGSTLHSQKTGKIMISTQIVFAVILIYTAFLFGKTLDNLLHKDLGINSSNLLMFSLQGDDSDTATSAQDVLGKIKTLPGVENASCTSLAILRNWSTSGTINLSVFDPNLNESIKTYYLDISPDFLKTLEIPLLSGNSFDAISNEGNSNQVIISRSLAKKAFPKGNAIGGTFKLDGITKTIIGVCGDIQYHSIRRSSEYLIYSPLAKTRNPFASPFRFFYIRSSLSPDVMSDTIRDLLRSEFPGAFAERFQTLDSNIANLVQSERNVAFLSSLFSLITIALICVGLFAQTSFEASSRMHEIGVRLTMGATPKSIVRRMLRQSILPVMVGLIIGLPLAVFAERLLQNGLYHISTIEPIGLLLAILLILTTSLLAVFIPVFKSSQLDPMNVLRQE